MAGMGAHEPHSQGACGYLGRWFLILRMHHQEGLARLNDRRTGLNHLGKHGAKWPMGRSFTRVGLPRRPKRRLLADVIRGHGRG